MDKTGKKKTTKNKKAVNSTEKGVKREVKNNDNTNIARNNDTINVPIPLGFLKHINNIILIANQRAHWQPNELIPVGTVLREIDNIINYYNSLEVSSETQNGGLKTSASETTGSS